MVPGSVSSTAAVASSLVVPQVAMLPATRITSAGRGSSGGGGSTEALPPPHAMKPTPVAAARQRGIHCSRRMLDMTSPLSGVLLLGSNEASGTQQRLPQIGERELRTAAII